MTSNFFIGVLSAFLGRRRVALPISIPPCRPILMGAGKSPPETRPDFFPPSQTLSRLEMIPAEMTPTCALCLLRPMRRSPNHRREDADGSLTSHQFDETQIIVSDGVHLPQLEFAITAQELILRDVNCTNCYSRALLTILCP
jgi:hypothetical protein